MTESELNIYAEDLAVLDWINANHKTRFSLDQLSGGFQKMVLKSGEATIMVGSLKECDEVIAGMMILARKLMKKEPS